MGWQGPYSSLLSGSRLIFINNTYVQIIHSQPVNGMY